MFRTALLRSARQALRVAPRYQSTMARPVARNSLFQAKQIVPAARFQAVRCYSASAGLSKDEIEGRIMDLLKNFDKEFSIEIPDKEADAIHSVKQAVDYIKAQPDGRSISTTDSPRMLLTIQQRTKRYPIAQQE
ncbi:unnamed protein product [Periconia digitata]|uniref:Acyl carrier protein n=1 Tax=Periconia digitata TaxID=1303443 RepID=A0A9W4UHH8_9PLEO|nr:unnamed protein product [Periconia digitata]